MSRALSPAMVPTRRKRRQAPRDEYDVAPGLPDPDRCIEHTLKTDQPRSLCSLCLGLGGRYVREPEPRPEPKPRAVAWPADRPCTGSYFKGCRCADCRASHARRRREYIARRRAAPTRTA